MTVGRLEVRTRVVEAAAQLLREHGPAAVTTRAVAEAAATQAPTIYRLFGDKDGLLDAVAEHELARYVSDKALAVETDDPVADLHVAWARHIRFGLANPALHTILTDPGRATPSPAAAAGLGVLQARVHRIAATGRLRVSERRAVELIHAAGVGAVHTLLATAVDQRDPQLAEQLYDSVMGTVLTDATASTTDNPAAAAVALRAAVPELTALSAGEQTLLAEWLDRITGS